MARVTENPVIEDAEILFRNFSGAAALYGSSYVSKTIINSVYGSTAARSDCELKDPRNVDEFEKKCKGVIK